MQIIIMGVIAILADYRRDKECHNDSMFIKEVMIVEKILE